MAVEDLTSLQTEDELFEQFCTDAATLPYPVDVRGMQPERVAPAMLHVEAIAHEQWQIKRKQIVQSAWLRDARGDSLTLLARGFFRLERFPATNAIQQIRLTDTAGVGGTTYTAGTRVAYATNGQEFRNVADITLPLNGYVDAEWRAEVAGSLGNVAAGSITRLRQPIVGVTVSNPAIGVTGGSLVTPGRDVETDEQLIQRCEDRWGSVGSGGNAAAYRFWVTESFTVDGLTPSITRVKIRDNNPFGPGSIGVVVANASGTATGPELARVDDYLQVRKALGSGELVVQSATAQTVAISAQVSMQAGYTASLVSAAIEAALDTYQSEFSIGGLVYVSEIVQRIMAVDGVYNVVLASPAADVVIGSTAIVAFSYSLTVA